MKVPSDDRATPPNDVRPPITVGGPLAWVRQNLFSGWVNGLITVLIGAALAWILLQIGQWAVTEARWSVVTNNLRLFLIGQFPADQAWRVWLNLAVLSVLAGLSAGVYGQSTRALIRFGHASDPRGVVIPSRSASSRPRPRPMRPVVASSPSHCAWDSASGGRHRWCCAAVSFLL